MRKEIKPQYVPNIQKQNFDSNHVNNKGWNDEEEIQEYQAILKRQSQKQVFNSYYFDKADIERVETDFANKADESEDLSDNEMEGS
jgi:hypothetical protein